MPNYNLLGNYPSKLYTVQSLVKMCLLTCFHLREKNPTLTYCPKRSLCCLQLYCCMRQGQEKAQWAADCPPGLTVSKLIAQLWPFQQGVFKTKLGQSGWVAHVRVPSIPSRHYGQDYIGLAPSPCIVLQCYPASYVLSNKLTWHHATPQDNDICGWYHATSLVDCTTALIYLRHLELGNIHTQNKYIQKSQHNYSRPREGQQPDTTWSRGN